MPVDMVGKQVRVSMIIMHNSIEYDTIAPPLLLFSLL